MMLQPHADTIIIGGGAAGFFYAINYQEKNPTHRVIILEKSSQCLQKVRISGGGRCNVTNATFNISDLVLNYPRGNKALRSVFSRFQPRDTLDWFSARGITLYAQDDLRIFPSNNRSETIIDCFLKETKRMGIKIYTQQSVRTFEQNPDDNQWVIKTTDQVFKSTNLLIATGNSPYILNHLAMLGHHIIPPLPSLFTFKCKNPNINCLSGIAVHETTVSIEGYKITIEGSLLITHFGFSGPAILKLSAWMARELADLNYHFILQINWVSTKIDQCLIQLTQFKNQHAANQVDQLNPYAFPKRLWRMFLIKSTIDTTKNWADLNKHQLNALARRLTQNRFSITGKYTFKEEFVTAGGVDLKDIDLKTMESRRCSQLYFSGEVIDVDGVTGGFNFQNAWSTAWIASQH